MQKYATSELWLKQHRTEQHKKPAQKLMDKKALRETEREGERKEKEKQQQQKITEK